MQRKGYGRIYVLDPSKVQRVEEVGEELDPYEWGPHYKIKGMVAPWPESGEVELLYTHKFEPDLDALTAACWREGIAIWCISQRGEFFNPPA